MTSFQFKASISRTNVWACVWDRRRNLRKTKSKWPGWHRGSWNMWLYLLQPELQRVFFSWWLYLGCAGGGFSWLSFRGRQWVAGNCLIMDTWCVRTLQPSLSWLLPAWERLIHYESALSPFSCSVSSERSPGYAPCDNQGTCFGSLLLFWIKMLAELRLPLQGGSRRAKDSPFHQVARISSSYISSACGMESEQQGKKRQKQKNPYKAFSKKGTSLASLAHHSGVTKDPFP